MRNGSWGRVAAVLAGFLLCAPAHAEWKPLGPFGGPAALIQSDPNSGRTLLAGTTNALLFRSMDSGATWRPLRFPPQLRSVLHSLLIHPGVRGLYLAGIAPDSPGVSGLWRSDDGGSTWRPVPGFENAPVRAIAVFRGNSQILAAGTDTGVFSTRDGGVTWRRISPRQNGELQPVVSLAIDPKDSRVIYAGTPHLPWRTLDEGEHWSSIHTGMIDDSDVFSILVDRNRPQRVFATACSGIYRSINGGAAWTRLPDARDASVRTYVLAQDPQYENVFFAGTTHGMVRSRDGGASWEKIVPDATRSISFDMGRLGRIFIATDQRGVLRSDDNGKTWEPVNHGIANRRFTPVAAGEGGALVTTDWTDSPAAGLLRLANGSDEWTRIRAENSGGSWARLPAPARDGKVTALLSPQAATEGILVAVGSVMYSARKSPAGFQTMQFPAPVQSLIDLESPWTAAISGAALYLSPDGESWEGSRVPDVDINDAVALSGGRLMAATTGGLRVSSDRGKTWQAVSEALEGNTVQAICRHPGRPSQLFAARYGEVLASADEGRAWSRISPEDWPVESIRQLIVTREAPGRLLVLTRQQGIFALSIDEEPGRPKAPPATNSNSAR
jgi:photosystem II stability/assembly factor-like uncharacterized protein